MPSHVSKIKTYKGIFAKRMPPEWLFHAFATKWLVSYIFSDGPWMCQQIYAILHKCFLYFTIHPGDIVI